MNALAVGDARIEVGEFDLLDQTDLEVIVNAANGNLWHGGGLAALIAEHAGETFVAESQDHPEIADGDAGITSAGDLPFEAVIHAVGPVWRGGDHDEASLLESAHRAAISLAAEEGLTRIGFPAISCGIFGYPVQLAAPVAVGAARAALQAHPEVELIRFCLFEDEHVRAFEQALSKLKG